MPRITFNKISKSFGNNPVIHDFTTEIEDEEFLVLLGPSGCGKSTMLRMIAGLTDISSGELLFDGRKINDLEPRERNIAFVFQSYALYPHMTVRGNIAFPLIMDRFKPWYHIPFVNSVMRRVLAKRPDVRDRVLAVAETLELTDYLDRRPKALSGGQRQRVAVARALVRDPSVYLLDEPLSNLDAKLRTQMRAEILALYQRVGKTFVYVTHDQVEAMTMATRIVVLNEGRVQQIGRPEEIYNAPANTFVARFIGSPAMNLIPVTVRSGQTTVTENQHVLDVPCGLPDGEYLLGIRPEKISRVEDEADGVPAWITAVEQHGGESVIAFRFHEPSRKNILSAADTRSTYQARIPGAADLSVGISENFVLHTEAVVWFDAQTGTALGDEASAATARPVEPAASSR
jgi:multiple sugar transport system ATP-binding protein